MGKNKNRNRQQDRQDQSRSAAEQAEERMKSSVAEQPGSQNASADVPRKRAKRFGHN